MSEGASCLVEETATPAGEGGGHSAVEMTMVTDNRGQVFVEIRVGDEVAYIRPKTFAPMREWVRRTWFFENCVWNRRRSRCEAPWCNFHRRGNQTLHVGRLQGVERLEAVRELYLEGTSVEDIAIELHWHPKAIYNDIAEIERQTRTDRLLAVAGALENELEAAR